MYPGGRHQTGVLFIIQLSRAAPAGFDLVQAQQLSLGLVDGLSAGVQVVVDQLTRVASVTVGNSIRDPQHGAIFQRAARQVHGAILHFIRGE